MKITLKNRLSELLRKRRIRSASEFARRMVDAGYPMSSSHATRFEKDDPPATDLRFVTFACNVLQCMPSDLYDITIELEAGETIDPGTLVPPPHAVILRSGVVQPQVLPIKADAHAEPHGPSWAVSKVGAGPKGTAPKTAFDRSTGPKGVLFPYKTP